MIKQGVVIKDIAQSVICPVVKDVANPRGSGQGIQTKIGGYILTKLGFRIKIK